MDNPFHRCEYIPVVCPKQNERGKTSKKRTLDIVVGFHTCGWKGGRQLKPGSRVVNTGRERSIRVFFFARIYQSWLAAAPVKAPDELAALGLDRRLASRKSPAIQAKESII
jgi:hypothetical protein